MVVDQSPVVNYRLQQRADVDDRLTVLRQEGHGASRARNLAWRRVTTEWVVFLDDDCRPDPDWAEAISAALVACPNAGFVSGEITGAEVSTTEHLPVTTCHVGEERARSGRWTLPWDIGFTASCAIRRSTLQRLGGLDDRLGAGAPDFPSAEDMDFNYRFLKAGGVAFVTPRIRVHHEQWRAGEELASHFRGYAQGWSGFAMKHLRGGDVIGGLWLWSLGVLDLARMLTSALRRRSLFRLRVAASKLQGLVKGTAKGLVYPW